MPVVITAAKSRDGVVSPASVSGPPRNSIWLAAILSLAFALRFAGLHWGQAYGYFSQGDGVEAYAVAVNYGHGGERAQYIAQPNYNEKSKLPGPLWTIFCFLGLRFGAGITGVSLALILLNTATVYFIYNLTQRMFGSAASLWAALLAATSPWAVYYSVAIYIIPTSWHFWGGYFVLPFGERSASRDPGRSSGFSSCC
jgi:dolichyl-phosphate-mannose-protein mannosyltransferase